MSRKPVARRITPAPVVVTEGRHFTVAFKPLTTTQRRMLTAYEENTVLIVSGAAGTGKTITAAYLALKDVRDGKRERVVVMRPSVTCGEELGFLKGDLLEKLEPLTKPFAHAVKKVAFNVPKDVVSYEALAFLGGCTYEDTVVILDEAQNATRKQLKRFLTRLGRNSKMLLLGDAEQSDLPYRGSHDYENCYCDLDEVAVDLEGLGGVGVVEFSLKDVVRHPLVGAMLGRL